MQSKMQESSHRVGVAFATVVVLMGMVIAMADMAGGARPWEMVQVAGYTLGLAVLCYVVVRLVGWAFAEAMLTTREQQARNSLSR